MAHVHQRIITQAIKVSKDTDMEIAADSQVGKALVDGYSITQISQSVVADAHPYGYQGPRNGTMYALFVLEKEDTRGEELFGAA
ncbi:hypothetical protein SAMN00120144_4079 [Hymenobacter roseosalivarius DSM 11622]|uniref:Uncharacterized protein n=1 Tax=Hymenobacter roseosalivarius DSM 11622 TaxID=645990 RepID=A0A1W1W4U1_9BACT|nr:hypothetical protein [Hymenobacter roseosalivarius]SMC00637.1 hypothetical protein SAMN00120144_4079 [Hymenobacter roseosalivarius DSM 11622]